MSQIKLYDKTFQLFILSESIQLTVKNMAEKITKDLKDKNPVFIGILNGAFMFTSDLIKHLRFDCNITFVKLSTYRNDSSTGKCQKLIGLNDDLSGRTVVITEDIIDTGFTIKCIYDEIKKNNPSEIRVASMFFKPDACKKSIHIDYVGMEVENEFIVGYGLDYNGLGRNYQDVYKIKY
jgi:hypoxanthine phosphoribosyltransferase